MEYVKKIGLLLCAFMFMTMQSCVRNDLDECPPLVRYAVSFEYLLHTAGGDLFPEDVEKMYLYVFDHATGVCVYADTTITGPFSNNFIYNLPLNTGTYDIIVWGWGRETGDLNLDRSTGVIPAIIVGQTKIDQAKFILDELDKNIDDNVHGKIEKTFYGEIADKYIPPFISEVDTVDLINISNMLRVIIPDADNLPNWQSMKVTIEGDDGSYKFIPGVNSPLIDPVTGHVFYNPYQTFFDDSILRVDRIYTGRLNPDYGNDAGIVADISTLRLVDNDQNMLVVVAWDSDNDPSTPDEKLTFPLIDLLKEAVERGTFDFDGNYQKLFDQIDRWEIIIEVTKTNITIAIAMEDWHIVIQDVTVGGWDMGLLR